MAAEKYRNRQRINTGSYYTYGNVAHELQPDYSPYRFREEEEERRKAEERLAKEEARENRISSVKMIGVALVLFIVCIAFMGMNVLVDNAEVSLRQQKSELESLKSANAILEAELTEQERQVIQLRYGLQGQVPMRQREVAQVTGISRSYISRIEKRALQKLRQTGADPAHPVSQEGA